MGADKLSYSSAVPDWLLILSSVLVVRTSLQFVRQCWFSPVQRLFCPSPNLPKVQGSKMCKQFCWNSCSGFLLKWFLLCQFFIAPKGHARNKNGDCRLNTKIKVDFGTGLLSGHYNTNTRRLSRPSTLNVLYKEWPCI